MGASASDAICATSLEKSLPASSSACSCSAPNRVDPHFMVLDNVNNDRDSLNHLAFTDQSTSLGSEDIMSMSHDSERTVPNDVEDTDFGGLHGFVRPGERPPMCGVTKKDVPACIRPGGACQVRVVVMRHGERLDHLDPQLWAKSQAAKRYPHDCPITDKGRRQATEVAQDLHHRLGDAFSLVVTSPYMRCVHTAVEVCRYLRLPLCIDAELGEIFGEMCFGSFKAPGPPRRSAAEVEAFIPADIELIRPLESAQGSAFFGDAPEWGESLDEARLRTVGRVEQYAARAVRLRGASFILVTHADCVAACLTLALAGQRNAPKGRLVEKVNFCGYVLLERDAEMHQADLGLMDEDANWTAEYSNVVVNSGLKWGDGHHQFDERKLEAEAEALAEKRKARTTKGSKERNSTIIAKSPTAVQRSQQALGFQEYVGEPSFQEPSGPFGMFTRQFSGSGLQDYIGNPLKHISLFNTPAPAPSELQAAPPYEDQHYSHFGQGYVIPLPPAEEATYSFGDATPDQRGSRNNSREKHPRNNSSEKPTHVL